MTLYTLQLLIVDQEHREEVRSKCVLAEPRHGPVWQRIAKDDRNVGKGTKLILELVADSLE